MPAITQPRSSSRKPTLSIGRLAKAAGVGVDAIRFYERIGLLPAPRRSASGYRLYRPGDRRRSARSLAAAKLEVVEGKLAELSRLRDALRSLVDECSGAGDPARCSILAALGADAIVAAEDEKEGCHG